MIGGAPTRCSEADGRCGRGRDKSHRNRVRNCTHEASPIDLQSRTCPVIRAPLTANSPRLRSTRRSTRCPPIPTRPSRSPTRPSTRRRRPSTRTPPWWSSRPSTRPAATCRSRSARASCPIARRSRLLSRSDDVPGQLGAEEMKILIIGVDTDAPELYFLNTKAFEFHYFFARDALEIRQSNGEFNLVTYFRDDRSNLAGTIIANDRFESGGKQGLYALEFWPTDPVGAKHVALAYDLVTTAMPFAADQIAYHPAGDTQEALFARDEGALRDAGVRTILTSELFANVTYVALNLGEGFGVLSAIDPATSRPPTIRDVALFTTLPNDLGHVAGVISATPQTPLSHINLKAKQNDTPNAYVRDALSEPRVVALLGKVVRYAVTPDDFELDEATPEQVEAWLAEIRPTEPQTPPRDLSLTEIKDLDELRHGDVRARRREGRERRRAAQDAAGRHGPRRLRDPVRALRRVHDRGRLLRPGAGDHRRPGARQRLGQARRGARRPAQADQEGRRAARDRAEDHRAAGEVPGGARHPLPLVDEQRGPRGLQRRRPVRLVHAPRRRGRPREDRQAGLGVAVEPARVRRARVSSHRPPQRGDGRPVSPELRRRGRQRRRRDEEPVRPQLAAASTSTSRSASRS